MGQDQDALRCAPPRRTRRRRSSCPTRSDAGSGSGGRRRGRRARRRAPSSSSSASSGRSSSSSSSSTGSSPSTSPLPFSSCFWAAAISSVSMPASASTWWRRSSVPEASRGGLLREHALEAEHQRVAHFHSGDGSRRPAADLGERVVERAARRACRGRGRRRVLVGTQKGSPAQASARSASAADAVGRLRADRKLRGCLLPCVRHAWGAALKGCARGKSLSEPRRSSG